MESDSKDLASLSFFRAYKVTYSDTPAKPRLHDLIHMSENDFSFPTSRILVELTE